MKFSSIFLSLGAATLVFSAAVPATELESQINSRATAEVEEPLEMITDGGLYIPELLEEISLVPREGALFERDLPWFCSTTTCDGRRFIHPNHESEMWWAFDAAYGRIGFLVQPYQTYCIKCRGGVIAFVNINSYSQRVTVNDWHKGYDCIRPHILSGESHCFLSSLDMGYKGGWRVGAIQEWPGLDQCNEGCA